LLVIGCHIILGDRWCDIIVLNVHAPTEDKCDDTKDSFYDELEGVFDQFPKYHRDAYNILVGRPEGRRPLGRPRRRREDNIKMDLGGIGFGDVD
jgi:hypothetical protein